MTHAESRVWEIKPSVYQAPAGYFDQALTGHREEKNLWEADIELRLGAPPCFHLCDCESHALTLCSLLAQQFPSASRCSELRKFTDLFPWCRIAAQSLCRNGSCPHLLVHILCGWIPDEVKWRLDTRCSLHTRTSSLCTIGKAAKD